MYFQVEELQRKMIQQTEEVRALHSGMFVLIKITLFLVSTDGWLEELVSGTRKNADTISRKDHFIRRNR